LAIARGARLDLVDFRSIELKLRGRNQFHQLFGPKRSEDRSCNCGISQNPRNRKLRGCATMSSTDLFQEPHQLQIVRKPRFLEIAIAAPPIVGRQSSDSLARHRAGEQSGSHRRVSDYADLLAGGEGQYLGCHLAPDQRIRRLERSDRRNGFRAAHLLNVEFETPMFRTFPSFLSFARVAHPSSISASGIGQWIC
jgi:hypothetical protein